MVSKRSTGKKKSKTEREPKAVSKASLKKPEEESDSSDEGELEDEVDVETSEVGEGDFELEESDDEDCDGDIGDDDDDNIGDEDLGDDEDDDIGDEDLGDDDDDDIGDEDLGDDDDDDIGDEDLGDDEEDNIGDEDLGDDEEDDIGDKGDDVGDVGETDDDDYERASDHDEDEESDDENSKADSESDEDSEPDADEDVKHKKALSKLKQTDPEFYEYLQENDRKLLQFNASDESENESKAESDDEAVHKPPTSLEVDSDESDFEDSKKPKSASLVTLAMVQSWRKDLIENASKESIGQAVDAFCAALDRVTGEDKSILKVESGAVFNAVIEMCIMNLHPALMKFLKLSPGNLKFADKSKKWSKIKFLLQTYFSDLLRLLTGVTSEHIISVLLKHLHSMCSLVALYGKLGKTAVKYLTKLWSTGEETVRVLAFLCIMRLVTSHKSSLLNTSLKLMYIAYIRGSKFVSVNTLAQINFMRRSLASLFLIDTSLSYQHAFLYIRQLAIHFRNAVTIHKKENFQSVYNWQYMASLRLWVDLLSFARDNSDLNSLLYPLTQLIIGCIKLLPTAQFVPMRFHCIKLLIHLGRETDTYIPVLPFIVEGLVLVDLNRQHKKVSMKPFDFTCVLRMSKAAMTENAFTDAIVENVYNLLVDCMASNAHRITFPDIVVPVIFQLRGFVKDCKVGKYSAKIKQILLKIEENAKFVNRERNKLGVNLIEIDKIKAFEKDLLVQGTPFSKFYEQWRKVNQIQMMKRASEKAKKETEITLPVIKRKAVKKSDEPSISTSGPVVLFPSDDELDDDLQFEENDNDTAKKSSVQKIPKKKKKKMERKTHAESEIDLKDDLDQEDVVEDLKLSEF